MNPTLKKILLRLGTFVIDILIAFAIVAVLAIFHVITLPTAITAGVLKIYSLATGSAIGTSILGYFAATKTSMGTWLKETILGKSEKPETAAPTASQALPTATPAAIVVNVGTPASPAAEKAEITRLKEENAKLLLRATDAEEKSLTLQDELTTTQAQLAEKTGEIQRAKQRSLMECTQVYRDFLEAQIHFREVIQSVSRLQRPKNTLSSLIDCINQPASTRTSTHDFPTKFLIQQAEVLFTNPDGQRVTNDAKTSILIRQYETTAKDILRLDAEITALSDPQPRNTISGEMGRNLTLKQKINEFFISIHGFLAALICNVSSKRVPTLSYSEQAANLLASLPERELPKQQGSHVLVAGSAQAMWASPLKGTPQRRKSLGEVSGLRGTSTYLRA